MTDRIDTLLQNLERDITALKAEVKKMKSPQIKANQKVETTAETQQRLSKTSRYIDFSKEE
jgi:hypothetical protein